ncbi:uncharacterized protein MYCFIDRAFT_197070 [Pseudocercospora fijiensis CIRAD86]|uniref:Uncharacterized protein n=1 Tax=Pseudocercospora fijiensis (strain CIRAD86) TaxID=383855 RepID=M2YVP9_PSEFD|nr:uncharacterized protein MYCFIDRAFT_197070 [Pseudocercospora fijiensis CIRAD86]EME81760.1 hypothetical protein MYCFIDRAFT_197070 [Pseudocercospora fijiensis CIRAD86]
MPRSLWPWSWLWRSPRLRLRDRDMRRLSSAANGECDERARPIKGRAGGRTTARPRTGACMCGRVAAKAPATAKRADRLSHSLSPWPYPWPCRTMDLLCMDVHMRLTPPTAGLLGLGLLDPPHAARSTLHAPLHCLQMNDNHSTLGSSLHSQPDATAASSWESRHGPMTALHFSRPSLLH